MANSLCLPKLRQKTTPKFLHFSAKGIMLQVTNGPMPTDVLFAVFVFGSIPLCQNFQVNKKRKNFKKTERKMKNLLLRNEEIFFEFKQVFFFFSAD